MKKILIIGSSGLIGSELKENLKPYFYISGMSGKILYENPEQIAKRIEGFNVVINLAGYSVAGRWTSKIKSKIENSRIITTTNLVSSFTFLKKKPELFINASGISIYQDGHIEDETSINFAENFLASVVKKWEKAALNAEDIFVNTAILRFGIVLTKKAGAYPKIRRIINYFIGGPVGNGKQGMSIIHIHDVVKAIHFIIENKMSGIINLCIPYPSNNSEFTKILASKLKRPHFFRIPVFLLRLLLLDGHIMLSQGQKAYPGVLIKHGYEFKFPDVYKCVNILEE